MTRTCWMQLGCPNQADTWMITPEGQRIGPYCRAHAEDAKAEYAEKLGEAWNLQPEERSEAQ